MSGESSWSRVAEKVVDKLPVTPLVLLVFVVVGVWMLGQFSGYAPDYVPTMSWLLFALYTISFAIAITYLVRNWRPRRKGITQVTVADVARD